MSGTLAFKYFPQSTWRPSGFFAEFNSAQANTATQNQRALILGQILAAGTAVPNVPVLAYNQSLVNTLCGVDSMLALEYAAYRAQDPFGEVWILPLVDNPGGVAATGSLTFTGTATAAGTFPLYVMGVSVPVPIAVGDTPTVQAASAIAAINASIGTCLTASAGAAGVVTLTSPHKGLALNDVDLRVAYLGAQNGEVVPAGVAYTIAAMAGGTLAPVLTTALANLGVQTFDFIACPYTDAISLNALQAFLNDSAGRWSAIEMLYGHVFSAFRGTLGTRATFGTGRNDQHCSILGYFDSPTPAWLEAADWCAVHAIRFKVNPAVGVTGMALGLQAPPVPSQDTPGARNTMLYDGLSTFTVDPAGVCRIDRSITTYQTNPSGQIDNSYLSTNLLFQAMYAARYLAVQITTQFVDAGLILVQDGTPIGPGSPATTPSIILQSAIAIYAYLCTIFVVQDVQSFAANATASLGTKGQVLLYLPINFSDQVVSVAALIQFKQTT
jgi:phage tail sheath gpL-like